MKSLQKIKLLALILTIGGLVLSFAACSDDDESTVKVYEYKEQIGKKIKELTDMQVSAQYGIREGMFPEESRQILEEAVNNLKNLLELIKAKTIPDAQVPEETAKGLSNADKKKEEFLATKRTEDVVIPAELYVNGKNGGYIDFGSHPEYSAFSGGFTVDMWFKFEEIGSFDFILSTFIDNQNEADRYRKGWAVNYYGENGERNLRMTYCLDKDGLYEPWVRFEEAKKWFHLVYVWNPAKVDDGSSNPNSFKMYIDGALVKEEHWNNTNYTPNNEETPMLGFNFTDYGGAVSTEGKGANGYMKHMHIWNSVKTVSEIQEIMNNPDYVKGDESDLVCGWKFDEVAYDNNDIKDITGKYSAKLTGDFKWIEIK